MKEQDPLKEAAIQYAKKGIPVFPCKLSKAPYTKNGFKDATTDIDKVSALWDKYKGASIGMPTGEVSGMWVFDIDAPEGYESLNYLESLNGVLPDTLTQATGGGGKHYFFKAENNGNAVSNTSSKIGKKLDSRGNGGYVILSPSGHPKGGKYVWESKNQVINAPGWLIELLNKKAPAPQMNKQQQTGGNSKYGLAALSNQIIKMSGSGEGSRNDALNTAAFTLGQLIAGGELEIGHVENSLLGVAFAIGLTETEARKTIKSGFNSGMQVPKAAPKQENDSYYEESLSNLSNLSNLDTSQQFSAVLSNSQQFSAVLSSSQQENAVTPPANLAGYIKQFIENSNGSFTTRDIDNEFGLRSRKEKNARSSALLYMVKKKIINKDRVVAGKYHIIKSEIEWVDLDSEEEEKFDISLPFNLDKHVVICPHSIIVVAGTGDAGKTTFILNILKMNRGKKYLKNYLMSEMAPGEYKMKLKRFGEPLENWKCINAAQRSYDFNGVIQHHNRDGLTCIDYLEDIAGEYYKITSGIREIYDALGDGVAVVAIQKDSKAIYARGGEGTMEKSRLYLTIDYLATVPRGVICAMKILKVKNFTGDNYKNYELHFKIHGKNEMEVIMDWTPSHQVDRNRCIVEYERGFAFPDASDDEMDPIIFNGYGKSKVFRIRETQIVQWGAAFPNIEDVYGEVTRLSEQHNKKPFVKNFIHLSQIMRKLNNSKE